MKQPNSDALLMEDLFPWAEAFNITAEQVEMLRQGCTPEESPLDKALATQIIDENSYLNWARNHYSLPSVSPQFFSQGSHIKEPMGIPGNWDSKCFPIYQWDDVIYIGCVEPPSETPPNTQLVLCPASHLSSLWSSFEHDNAVTPPPPAELETPAAPAINLDFSSLTTETAPAAEATAPAPPTAPPAPAELETPAAPAINFSEVETLEVPSPAQTSEPVSAPPQETPAVPQPINSGAATTNPWSETLFTKLNEFYDAKMIITHIDEGFAPRFWSEHWKPQSKNCPFINVADANIFKIAHKTKRPFHGHISKNDVNDQFFSFWLNGEYPEQITIQPILNENTVVGMIAGVPRDKEDLHKKLQLIEETSQDALIHLSQQAA